MNRKFSVIKINGFKGILLAVFCIGCLIAGFLIFPGWICMHVWNYIAGFFLQAPIMNIAHGILLWCIIALSVYALNKGELAISFGTTSRISPNEERLREVFSKINEHNARNLSVLKHYKDNDKESAIDNKDQESDDKLIK